MFIYCDFTAQNISIQEVSETDIIYLLLIIKSEDPIILPRETLYERFTPYSGCHLLKHIHRLLCRAHTVHSLPFHPSLLCTL